MITQGYKDTKYTETIVKIKNILNNLHVKYFETIMESIPGMYSARLILLPSMLGTNGKGLTKDAALASAYAEMMERLQTFGLYKFAYPINEDILSKQKFYFSPDEKHIIIEDFIKQPVDHWPRGLLSIATYDKVALDKFRSTLTFKEQTENYLICVPYTNYTSKEARYVPERLIHYAYGSNGMTAGNSFEEALVGGISELLERYANKTIFYYNYRMPCIPKEYIAFYPDLSNLIDSICKDNQYSLIIKDASLGMGLPVVSVILIDKITGSYFIKFGAHPVFDVAVSRAITEAFQGRKLYARHLWMRKFSFTTLQNKDKKFDSICRTGEGNYDSTIFMSTLNKCDTSIWYKPTSCTNNTDYLRYLIEILELNKLALWYRNYSYLGFPTYHLVIEGLETVNILNDAYFEKRYNHDYIQSSLLSLESISSDERDSIIDYLYKDDSLHYKLVFSLLRTPVCYYSSYYKYYNINILFMLLLYQGRKKEALRFLDNYLFSNQQFYNEELRMWRCLREIIVGTDTYSRDDVFASVRLVFEDSAAERAIALFQKPSLFFSEFKCSIKDDICANCLRDCPIHVPCKQLDIVSLHEELTDRYYDWGEKNGSTNFSK